MAFLLIAPEGYEWMCVSSRCWQLSRMYWFVCVCVCLSTCAQYKYPCYTTMHYSCHAFPCHKSYHYNDEKHKESHGTMQTSQPFISLTAFCCIAGYQQKCCSLIRKCYHFRRSVLLSMIMITTGPQTNMLCLVHG